MIRTVSGGELYRLISGTPDVYTEKIRAYADGYGFGYGFCRFFAQDDTAVICSYYGSAVAAFTTDPDPDSAEELTSFLTCGQFAGVLMQYAAAERLGLTGLAERRLLMRGTAFDDGIGKLQTDVSPGEVYDIVRTGFDIDRETWYTDISHMTRHNIARAYLLEEAACAVRMYASNGVAYISYVCTLPEKRGQGFGTRLLKAVCSAGRDDGCDTYLICEDRLRRFYESAGFEICGEAAEIKYDLNETRRQ